MACTSCVRMMCGRVNRNMLYEADCRYEFTLALLNSDCNLMHAWSACPVLKHGPRSLTCMRVIGKLNPKA